MADEFTELFIIDYLPVSPAAGFIKKLLPLWLNFNTNEHIKKPHKRDQLIKASFIALLSTKNDGKRTKLKQFQ